MKNLIWILAALALGPSAHAANSRAATPTIEDASQNGDVLSKSLSGDSITGKKGSVAFSFQDSSGNLILPQLNASGYFNTFVTNFPSVFGVTQSTSPWVVSGTVTANQGSPPWSVSQSGTWTTGRTWTLASGTDSVTSIQGTSPWVTNVSQFGGNAVVTGTGASGSGIPRVTVSNDSNVLATQSGAWTVTANAGTNLNTSALALDTTVSGLQVSQGSTTSGQKGTLVQGAVTTAAPSYTTAQTSPLSLTTAGALRTDSSGSTQPISGTVTSNQGTSPWVTNVSQFGGTNVSTGTGTSGTGIPRVTVSNDSNILATQSGTWTTGRTWSLLNSTDSVNAVQSGAWTAGRTWTLASGTDSIASVQSGTWTVQQGTPPWSVVGNVASGATDSGNPVKTGLVFNTTQPTVTNGQRVDSQGTARGATIVATGVDALNVNNITGTVSLPTGAATLTAQNTGNASLSSIDGKIANNYGAASGAVRVAAQIGNATAVADFGAGTTSAQTVRAVLPTDQTGINKFLDSNGSGTITALNGAVTITTNGASNVYMSITGTWVATLGLQADGGDGVWAQTLGKLPFPSGALAAVIGSNVQVKIPCGGFKQIRIIATAFTSGTATITWNAGAGTGLTEVFNNDAASLQTTANAGTNLNTSALALSATQTNGTQKTQTVDGSGNVNTFTAETGTTVTKQAQDVNPISTGTGRFYTTFTTQQTATTAANATVFAMRNAAASTTSAFIENIYCRQGFNAANPLTRTQQTYIFQRFSAATATGGTQLTAALGDTGGTTGFTDIRFSDVGVTTTGITFVANNLATMACDTTQGITCQEPVLIPPSAWRFAPGEGLAIRLGVVAVVGVSISCNIAWREQ